MTSKTSSMWKIEKNISIFFTKSMQNVKIVITNED